MADWEQPSTTVLRKKGGPGGLEEQVDTLKKELQTASQRIAALERRLNQLETDARHNKGFVTGA